MSEVTEKQCTKCKEFKPATPEYFHRDKIMRDGLRPVCKVCVKEYQQNNHPKMVEAAYRWKNANPEKHKEAQSNFKKTSPKHLAYTKKYKEYNKEYNRQYNKEHRQEKIARVQRRKARKLGNGGSYTAEEWQALCKQYDYLCLCCKEQKPLTIDHVVPLSKGGSNSIDNLQPLCKSCNSRKATMAIDFRFTSPTPPPP